MPNFLRAFLLMMTLGLSHGFATMGQVSDEFPEMSAEKRAFLHVFPWETALQPGDDESWDTLLRRVEEEHERTRADAEEWTKRHGDHHDQGHPTGCSQLILSDREMISLPFELFSDPSIVHIHLSNNRLTALPPGMEGLPLLTNISIPYNMFTSVPKCIFDVPHLRDLDLHKNPITSFSPDFFAFLVSQTQKEEMAHHRFHLFLDERQKGLFEDSLLWGESYSKYRTDIHHAIYTRKLEVLLVHQ